MGDARIRECGGCTAKVSPADLADLLRSLDGAREVPGTLVGIGDDAAVIRIDDERAIVTTVDVCPPMVDDPEEFGAIAAANAIGDVLAMGGDVLSALTILSYPRGADSAQSGAILAGARSVVEECGAAIVGGHTVHGRGTLFGLAVTGVVHPDRIWRSQGARPGDYLVLSRPLGVGLCLSHGTGEPAAGVRDSVRRPVLAEAEALRRLHGGVHAVTDVTGFGLLGHVAEMASSKVTMQIDADAVPVLAEALRLAEVGHRTTAHAGIEEWVDPLVHHQGVDDALMAVLMDPQTTGGLLAAVSEVPAGFTVIGRVQPRSLAPVEVFSSSRAGSEALRPIKEEVTL